MCRRRITTARPHRFSTMCSAASHRIGVDSGPQDSKQYAIALLIFNAALFVFGFVVLSLQPVMPLNPLGRGMLAPSTIFNTVVSFMTNTNLQHYSGDQHFSNFSQIFFSLPNMFLSAAAGLRADSHHPGAAHRTLVRPVIQAQRSNCSARTDRIFGSRVASQQAKRQLVDRA